MLTMTDRFLAKIREKQVNLEMNNLEFSAYLGITRQNWEATIREENPFPLGPSIAYAAAHRFPDLHDAFLAWTQERKNRPRRPYTRRANAHAAGADAAIALADNARSELQEATR